MAFNRIMPLSNRNGSFTSPSVSVPAGATGKFRLWIEINATDLADPSKSLQVMLEISDNSGASWRPYTGFGWTCGSSYVPEPGAPIGYPSCEVNRADFAGKMARVTGQINGPMRFAVSVEQV